MTGRQDWEEEYWKTVRGPKEVDVKPEKFKKIVKEQKKVNKEWRPLLQSHDFNTRKEAQMRITVGNLKALRARPSAVPA